MLNENNLYNIDDLKYFEADVQRGKHKIKIEYEANVWVYQQEWVNDYSFRYSLAPAKYWKSFGGLSITIKQDSTNHQITTNLGNPIEGNIGAISSWKFNTLPGDLLIIEYHPAINILAQALINLEPFGIMIIVGIMLMGLHLIILKKYSKNDVNKKAIWLKLIGGLSIPYLMLHSYFISYNIIDSILGDFASIRHGYYFLIIFWYPVIFIVYIIILWLIQLAIQRKLKNSVQK